MYIHILAGLEAALCILDISIETMPRIEACLDQMYVHIPVHVYIPASYIYMYM